MFFFSVRVLKCLQILRKFQSLYSIFVSQNFYSSVVRQIKQVLLKKHLNYQFFGRVSSSKTIIIEKIFFEVEKNICGDKFFNFQRILIENVCWINTVDTFKTGSVRKCGVNRTHLKFNNPWIRLIDFYFDYRCF